MEPRLLLGHRQISLIVKRFAVQLLEQHPDFSDVAIVGLQPRGVLLSRLIYAELKSLIKNSLPLYGELDTTFFRDDFRRGDLLIPNENLMEFSTEKKQVVLVDDVLYTGRSVRAALDALLQHGRPAKVELMVLVDRQYNREVPIAADYCGAVVDTRAKGEVVKVEWNNNDYKVWIRQK
jgi:pyrimidine operon attenuation protein / uracil phosphoribosyltransferase